MVGVWMTKTRKEERKFGGGSAGGAGGGDIWVLWNRTTRCRTAGTLSVEETHVPTEVLGSCVEPDPVVEEERSALLLGLLGGGLLLGGLLLVRGLLRRGLGDRGNVSGRGLDLLGGGGLLHRGGLLGGRLLGRLLGGHASETHGW